MQRRAKKTLKAKDQLPQRHQLNRERFFIPGKEKMRGEYDANV